MTMADEASIRSHPEAAALPGHRAEWLEGAGGHRLRAALFPAENQIGSVVLSTGRTEFIEKYLEVIGELLARGFTVLAHDWRGQGLSDRLTGGPVNGHADQFRDMQADYRLLLDRYEAELPKPWILFSHSMGGCLSMLALASGEQRFSAAILSAPMLGLKIQRHWPARAVVWLMAHLGASNAYAMGGEADPDGANFEKDRLTHDRTRFERAKSFLLHHPDLALGGVTWGWVASAFSALAWLHRTPALGKISIPVTILGAGQENLVDNAGQALVAERLPHCRYLVIPQSFHEILMETDDVRAIFWREFDALASNLPPLIPAKAGTQAF